IGALAEFWRSGVIDRAGRFSSGLKTDRLRKTDEGYEFVLVRAEESGGDRDIVITQSDIENLLRAKAAVFAGIRSLISSVGVDLESISKIYVAGGFGNFIDLEEAVTIGLVPDVPRNKYRFVGNTSVYGAKLCLLSRQARERAREIARKITYLELSVGNTFMEEFVSALFLPHTNLELFPSLSLSTKSGEGGGAGDGPASRKVGEEEKGIRHVRTLAAGMK
ncbi:MAG TPA: ATP-binding protein, partial [Clostridia bacterium]|nr:ATP-binding protein [Clostridia bacterium]